MATHSLPDILKFAPQQICERQWTMCGPKKGEKMSDEPSKTDTDLQKPSPRKVIFATLPRWKKTDPQEPKPSTKD